MTTGCVPVEKDQDARKKWQCREGRFKYARAWDRQGIGEFGRMQSVQHIGTEIYWGEWGKRSTMRDAFQVGTGPGGPEQSL